MSVLITIFVIIVAILIHELAHAITAIAWGFEIQHIYIGLPIAPKITMNNEKGVPITISPWLIGGGVKLDNDAIYESRFIKKTTVFFSGPLINVFVGILSASIFFGYDVGAAVSREFVFASAESVKLLATGQVQATALVGPVGIAEVGTQAVQTDPVLGTQFIWMLINFVMGVFNLLPIPGLDGGQILLGAITSLSGNSKRVINTGKLLTTASLLVLVLGMVALTIKDILYLFR